MGRNILAWAPALGVAAWAVVRVLGLERGFPLVPLLAYTPLVAVAGVLAAVLAGLLRRRAAAAVALTGALVLGALVAPRALGGSDRGPSIGVLSINMLRGEADADAIVALARTTEADVLSVQELTPRSLARLRAAGVDALFPHAIVLARPNISGIALFSAEPLERLATPPGLRKPIAAGAATFAGVRIELSAVHPSAPTDGAKVAEQRTDLARLPPAGADHPRVLAGDFNATLDHAALRGLIKTGYEDAADRVGAGLKATWPAGRLFPPPVTIDHVLVDERLGVQSVSVHDIPDTDHGALFAEIVLRPG